MDDIFLQYSLVDVKRDLRRGIVECQKRCLLHSSKWLSELSFSLPEADDGCIAKTAAIDCAVYMEGIEPSEYDAYVLAKNYFELREYDRSAHVIRDCKSEVPRFLHLYATYMAKEKRRVDSLTDQTSLMGSGQVTELHELLKILRSDYKSEKLDGYGLYLYGVVLKALGVNKKAANVLEQSCEKEPMLWCAYLELAALIGDREKLAEVKTADHWMKHFFMAHTYLDLYLSDEALKIYYQLETGGFKNCVYITSQKAMAYHNMRDVDKAMETFKLLMEKDPYRLENIDTYSNLLFVKELKTEMANLAHRAVSINKYRPETCCVVGNYYSIRCDHQMAIENFKRALKLNPKYLAAWTLMGHEFMELKNTTAAIQSYRKAVEVNRRDYRAWYGLGQAYEILKMHSYSLYYFKIAHQLRPHDSRMLVAVGEAYEQLGKNENAIKCFWKACNVGDIEGNAMFKLASLHEKLGNIEAAVQCYILYCEDELSVNDKQSLHQSYITLATYYERKNDYERAAYYAYKCLDSEDRKREAQSILKAIENKRIDNQQRKPANSRQPADIRCEEDMDLEMSLDNNADIRVDPLREDDQSIPQPRNIIDTQQTFGILRHSSRYARNNEDYSGDNIAQPNSDASLDAETVSIEEENFTDGNDMDL